MMWKITLEWWWIDFGNLICGAISTWALCSLKADLCRPQMSAKTRAGRTTQLFRRNSVEQNVQQVVETPKRTRVENFTFRWVDQRVDFEIDFSTFLLDFTFTFAIKTKNIWYHDEHGDLRFQCKFQTSQENGKLLLPYVDAKFNSTIKISFFLNLSWRDPLRTRIKNYINKSFRGNG